VWLQGAGRRSIGRGYRWRGREVCDAAPHATSVYRLLKFQDEGEP
jgi:hypothetical protein